MQIMTVSKIRHYFNEYVWPGLGLFGESYILFSIGTLRPIWEMLYPQCFSGETCSTTLLSYITYSVVIGVIVGMIIIGTIAGSIGRRNGSITTAALMAIGSLGMTIGSFYFRNNPQAMLKNLVSFLFVFGIGVGGEYPLSASSASERAMSEMKNRLGTNDKLQDNDDVGGTLIPAKENDAFDAVKEGRGRRVILVFSMQGMGIFVNSLTLTFLFFITGQWKNNNGAEYYKNDDVDDAYYEKEDFGGDYSLDALLGIWITVYIIGALTLSYVYFKV
jgi:MFS family permease